MAFTRIARSLVLDQPFRLFGSGEQSRDVTYVEDAVRATIAAMCTGRAGRIYNVGGGSETSLNDIIHLLEDIAGRRLRVERDVTQAGDVDRTASDTASLRADVGWAPRVSIREGMTAHLGWVEEETAAGVS
jgi:nucleoside-diphosphate-sugar epimerase